MHDVLFFFRVLAIRSHAGLTNWRRIPLAKSQVYQQEIRHGRNVRKFRRRR